MGPWNFGQIKAGLIILDILSYPKKLILYVRHQTANLNTDFHWSAWSKEKNKPTVIYRQLRQKRTLRYWRCWNVVASWEKMLKSLLKENFRFNSELRDFAYRQEHSTLVTPFHFSIIPLPCSRYYNYWILFYIPLYCESKNGCYIPVELLLWSILLV